MSLCPTMSWERNIPVVRQYYAVSIGLEGEQDNAVGFTDSQYRALSEMIGELIQRQDLSNSKVQKFHQSHPKCNPPCHSKAVVDKKVSAAENVSNTQHYRTLPGGSGVCATGGRARHKIKAWNILGLGEISMPPGRYTSPGKHFDWSRIRSMTLNVSLPDVSDSGMPDTQEAHDDLELRSLMEEWGYGLGLPGDLEHFNKRLNIFQHRYGLVTAERKKIVAHLRALIEARRRSSFTTRLMSSAWRTVFRAVQFCS
eukprot:Skav223139  [mRNA]  locus=scaffold470:178184:178948:+ [translate_table: standard]